MASTFSAEEVRDLAARASTIDERLTGRYIVADTLESTTQATRRLKAWCQAATDGDENLFRTHLARDGIDIERVTPLLGEVRLHPEEPAPTWAETFCWAVEAMCSSAPQNAPRKLADPDAPLPFEDLFVPLVLDADQRPKLAEGLDTHLITASARLGLQRCLLKRLTDLCGPTLYQGFTLFRMVESPLAMHLGFPVVGSPGSRTAYDRYIAALRLGELRSYFLNRPVLARLVATLTDLWIAATAEFIGRLHADLAAIRDVLNASRSPGPVTEIVGGLSDPHNGGRTVLRLTFASGLKVGYKPKDLGLDVAWRRLLCRLEDCGAPPSAQAPAVVARQGYGWVEWIEPAPCASPAEAQRFFQRAGAMLCLLHSLDGIDFHLENVIARGDCPIAVDLETLMHPRLPNPKIIAGSPSAAAIAAERLHQSVLATGYLPNWVVLLGGQVVAMGGLNPSEIEEPKCWQFHHVNTDGMKFTKMAIREDRPPHLPTLENQPLPSNHYRNEIMSGYEAMYRFLMERRAILLHDEGPLAPWHAKIVRVLLRPTVFYYFLIRRCLKGQNLCSGVDWDLHFEFLTRLDSSETVARERRAIQRAERRSLRLLDVPFVTTQSDRRDLFFSDGAIVEEYFAKSSCAQLSERLSSLSEVTLQEELRYIEQALQSAAEPASLASAAPWQTASRLAVPANALTSGVAIYQARAFAVVLRREAAREGLEAAWVGAVPLLPGEERAQLEVIGHDLHAGASGVAVFLSALYRLTGEPSDRELALAALEPLRRELKTIESSQRFARVVGIGGTAGIGSVVYALVRSAELLADAALLNDAACAAALISDDRIAADRSLDIVHGVAGAILGLLALHQARPDIGVLQRAVDCGRHLLSKQRDSAAGGRAWRTSGDSELTGFAHGAAGIAYALLRLYRATGDVAFRTAARDGIAYETNVFSAEARNWPHDHKVARRRPSVTYPCQWCHGAAGIGLARVGALDVLEDCSIRTDIDVAIQTTIEYPIVAMDHLCCGNFGRLEFLFTAGRRLGRDDLVGLALDRAALLVAGAQEAGSFKWGSTPERYSPGFFTGMAGVGYELLRLTHADVLPSVLLWE